MKIYRKDGEGVVLVLVVLSMFFIVNITQAQIPSGIIEILPDDDFLKYGFDRTGRVGVCSTIMNTKATIHKNEVDNHISLLQHIENNFGSPIIIDDDGDFISYGFPGSGAENDPYIIENYDIVSTITKGVIKIKGTTKNFIIRNCHIETNGDRIVISDISSDTARVEDCIFNNNIFDGMVIYKADGIIITNNIFRNNKHAIYVRKSISAFVYNNTFVENRSGINLAGSSASIIENNTCFSNGRGISVTSAPFCVIRNNYCENNNVDGISLFSSENSLITNNTCSNNEWEGISIIRSGFTTISNNILYNDGFHFSDSDALESFNIFNNWVNDKPLGFFSNLEYLEINETIYGQLVLVNCLKPSISNQILSNTSVSILLCDCNEAIIFNNTCNNNDANGIDITSSDSCLIYNNTCNNNKDGIYIESSNQLVIDNNTLVNNWVSIYLTESSSSIIDNNICVFSKNHGIMGYNLFDCLILNNTISNHHNLGVRISYSQRCIIANNTCENNNWEGIYLLTSDKCIVYNNYCLNNSIGIYIGHSGVSMIPEYIPMPPTSYSCVVSNHLEKNREYGVYLDKESENNAIHHNSFIESGIITSSQGYDDGKGNIWYNKEIEEGNYWSNIQKSSTYKIDGKAGSIDKYPLKESKTIPMPTLPCATSRTSFSYIIIPISLVITVLIYKKKNRKKHRNVTKICDV